jgi:hypothetical protein
MAMLMSLGAGGLRVGGATKICVFDSGGNSLLDSALVSEARTKDPNNETAKNSVKGRTGLPLCLDCVELNLGYSILTAYSKFGSGHGRSLSP